MTMYNHAFDLYHCIYRIIHILMRLEENDILELDMGFLFIISIKSVRDSFR